MKLKKMTCIICAAAMLSTFAAAPIGQASAYTIDVQASTNQETPDDAPHNEETFTSGGYEYVTAESGVKIIKYTGSDKNIDVPSEIDGKKVTTIGRECFADNNNVESITIPEGVTSIEDQAFKGCTSLKNISLPDSLVHFESEVFQDCTAIEEVTLPDNIDPEQMGIGTFRGCSSLKKVTRPQYTASIYEYYGCSSLEYAPLDENAIVIPHCVFEGCTSLKEAAIPKETEKIFQSAFKDCVNLEKVVFEGNTEIIDGDSEGDNPVFHNCPKLTIYGHDGSNAEKYAIEHEIPFVSLDVYTSGDYEYCIVDGTLKIMKYNGSTENIEVPAELDGIKVTWISLEVFAGHEEIVSVKIPEGVMQVGHQAFMGCTNLKEVQFPSTLKILGSGVFRDCRSIEEVTIPDSVEDMGIGMFQNCSSLKKVTLPNYSVSPYMYSGCIALEYAPLDLSEEAGDVMPLIPHRVFEKCTSLREVTIPVYMEKIYEGAFADCENLEKAVFLGNTEIIDGTEGGDEDVFVRCPMLTIYGHDGSNAEKYAAEHEIPFVSLDKPQYNTSDEDLNWDYGKTDGITLSVKLSNGASAEKFESFEIDGKTVDPKYYTVTSSDDGVNITLDYEYMQTFGVGLYNLCAKFADGEVTTNLVVDAAPEPKGIYGDIDGDGFITAADALAVLRVSVELDEFSPEDQKKADIDSDGSITAADALAVLRFSVGISDQGSMIGSEIN